MRISDWSSDVCSSDLASPISTESQAAFAPPPIEQVVAAIKEHKPDLVFAAHVETASGIMLPEDYMRQVAAAVHAVGGLFVLDRSEEHTSELQSLMRNSYAVFCLKKKRLVKITYPCNTIGLAGACTERNAHIIKHNDHLGVSRT